MPDARALLYAEYIELLLLRWRQRRGVLDLLEQTWPAVPRYRPAGADGPAAAMRRTSRPPATRTMPAHRPTWPTRWCAASWASASPPMRRAAPSAARSWSTLVLHRIATRNGLLLKRGGEQEEAYAFPHRSFQEFLVATTSAIAPTTTGCVLSTRARSTGTRRCA